MMLLLHPKHHSAVRPCLAHRSVYATTARIEPDVAFRLPIVERPLQPTSVLRWRTGWQMSKTLPMPNLEGDSQ